MDRRAGQLRLQWSVVPGHSAPLAHPHYGLDLSSELPWAACMKARAPLCGPVRPSSVVLSSANKRLLVYVLEEKRSPPLHMPARGLGVPEASQAQPLIS